MTKKPRYWCCVIGTTDQDKLPKGADSPMRNAVQGAFKKLTGKDAKDCWSGWGITETQKDKIVSV